MHHSPRFESLEPRLLMSATASPGVETVGGYDIFGSGNSPTVMSARQRETLGRGMHAVYNGNGALVSWRLLSTDSLDVGFNLYRKVNGQTVRLNAAPIRQSTNFFDDTVPGNTQASYWVRPLVGGAEASASPAFNLNTNQARLYTSIPTGGATIERVGVGDLNGDGEYDYVIRTPAGSLDPAPNLWHASANTYKLKAFTHDGQPLWTWNLGRNIEQGIWYSPVTVYDFNGDGFADVAAKDSRGYDTRGQGGTPGRVETGPEYLTIRDGKTGRYYSTAWPDRNGFADYNSASRNQLVVAYLDGVHPSLVAVRGTYDLIKVVEFKYTGSGILVGKQWKSTQEANTDWEGEGNHSTHAADVDNDGKDEIVLSAAVLDDDLTGLWLSGNEDADHVYVGDLDPTRAGLELYAGYEYGQSATDGDGIAMWDAATGSILWKLGAKTTHVHSEGLVSDISADHAGAEAYSVDRDAQPTSQYYLHDAKGNALNLNAFYDKQLEYGAVYWDDDPQREIVVNSRIYDFAEGTAFNSNAFQAQIEGEQIGWADVFGDSREEIITQVGTELRVYSTDVLSTHRRVSLMEDPLYRTDVASQGMGYAQVPTSSYWMAGTRAVHDAAQRPYSGTAVAVGTGISRIEAEHYDWGGEGVAYHDTTAGSTRNHFRADNDVDAFITTDPQGGGYEIGWASAGEYLEYTVNVQQAGDYILRMRTARGSAGSTQASVSFGGVDKTGQMDIASTGSWTNWSQVEKTVSLGAGIQVMRVDFHGGFDVNWFELESTQVAGGQTGQSAYGGSAVNIGAGTTRIEAEHFDIGGQGVAYLDNATGPRPGQTFRSQERVGIESTADTGGGYNVGWIESGERLEYTVRVDHPGNYQLRLRVARSNNAAGTARIGNVSFGGVTKATNLTVPSTGGWQSWQTIITNVSLSAGLQVVKLQVDQGGFNFNWFELTKLSSNPSA